MLKVEDKKNYLEAEKDREGWEGLLCELGGSNVVLVLVLWPVTERERGTLRMKEGTMFVRTRDILLRGCW